MSLPPSIYALSVSFLLQEGFAGPAMMSSMRHWDGTLGQQVIVAV